MKNFSKEKIYGLAGTAVFHMLLLLLLYLLVMEHIPPQPEKSNIEMQGAVEDVAGEKFIEAKVVKDVPQQVQNTPSSASSKVVKEPLIAQNSEPSLPVDTVKPNKKKEAKQPAVSDAEKKRIEEEKRKAAEEAARKAAEEAERKKKEKIANSVAGAFSSSAKTSSAGGENDGLGFSGKAVDGTDKGSTAGTGNNSGPVYSVGKRTVVKELSRNIPVQEEGDVVVYVTVNPADKVVKANAKTTSVTLKQVAEREAYKVVFNKVSSLDNEEGTITFRFRMNY